MKASSPQQEILLVASSTLLRMPFCKRENWDNHHTLSHIEQLEEACWNGSLYEMLPEIMERTASGKRLFLWHIWHRESVLQIELREFPSPIEVRHSIISSFFLLTTVFN